MCVDKFLSTRISLYTHTRTESIYFQPSSNKNYFYYYIYIFHSKPFNVLSFNSDSELNLGRMSYLFQDENVLREVLYVIFSHFQQFMFHPIYKKHSGNISLINCAVTLSRRRRGECQRNKEKDTLGSEMTCLYFFALLIFLSGCVHVCIGSAYVR